MPTKLQELIATRIMDRAEKDCALHRSAIIEECEIAEKIVDDRPVLPGLDARLGQYSVEWRERAVYGNNRLGLTSVNPLRR